VAAQPGRGGGGGWGRQDTARYDTMSFVLDYSVNNTDSSPSPPTSRVGFLLIRASIVVLLAQWSLDCRHFVAMVLGSYGPGLSSFWSYGPWVIVVLLVPPDG